MSCNDRYKHEREGADAARWGERYDFDHQDKVRNAQFDREGCDAVYADAYQREIDSQNEQRREEEAAEERRMEAQRAEREFEERMMEERWHEEQQAAEQGGDEATA